MLSCYHAVMLLPSLDGPVKVAQRDVNDVLDVRGVSSRSTDLDQANNAGV